MQETQSAASPDSIIPIEDYFGQSLLKERINASDLIARVRLTSTEPTIAHIVYDSFQDYHPAIKYTFEALEYLRGSGGDEIIAVAPEYGVWFATEQEALMLALRIVAERDAQWDNRQAIVFLRDYRTLTPSQYEFVSLINIGDYTIDSLDKTWLPEDIAGGIGQTRFLLDSPVLGAMGGASATHQAPTIMLSNLRSQVATENETLKVGEVVHGREEYRKCLARKYKDERIAESGNLEYRRIDIGPVDSGLPSGTRIGDPNYWGSTPEDIPGDHIEDNDAHLFNHKPLRFHIGRPLPNGGYRFYWSFWGDPLRPICGADVLPEEIRKSNEVFVNVIAPEGTLHEAFFDPVLDTGTSTVGADAMNGVLKPSAFTDASGAATTISRLTWESDAVHVNLIPHTALHGHILDFIEMDGSVSLSLHVADATADAANDMLKWTVSSQPWQDGDKLMLRIRKAPKHPPP